MIDGGSTVERRRVHEMGVVNWECCLVFFFPRRLSGSDNKKVFASASQIGVEKAQNGY
jgi:hypothetical protein